MLFWEEKKMDTHKKFLIVWVLVVCFSFNLNAIGEDKTFTSDGVIQDGDDYNLVDVYGDTTIVDMIGGEVALLWTYDQSIVNISGGLVAYAQTNDQSIINISGGLVHEPRAWYDSIINVTGGECWNVEVGGGQFDISGGQITGKGIYAPSTGSVVNVYGYGFAYDPFAGGNDGQLTGFWRDTSPFSIDFYHPGTAPTVNSYDAVVLHEVTPIPAPDAVLLGSLGLSISGWLLHKHKELEIGE